MGLTPMMRQYQEVKAAHQDALLMFRLGDFYELFFEDAVTASRELDITLTGRDAGEAGRIPMCGVPYHAVEQYLERLIDRGYRVAICEQVEDPKAAKGLVQREVVRIVTPGTALSKDTDHRFLAALVASSSRFGLAFVDVGTGEVLMGEADGGACADQLRLFAPIEIVVEKGAPAPHWLAAYSAQTEVLITERTNGGNRLIEEQYGVSSVSALGLAEPSAATKALALALTYIDETQKMKLRHLQDPAPLFEQTHLALNQTAIHHLELTATARDGQKKGSLLGLIDATVTAAGGRLLRSWLERPLCREAEIVRRHDAVGYFVDDLILREEVRASLRGVHDLARLVARFAFGSGNPRDLLSLAHSLIKGQAVIDTLSVTEPPELLASLIDDLPDLLGLAATIEASIVDDPPIQTREGGIFRSGVDSELDRLRELQTSGRTWLRDLEQRERERTGIKSLKVGYNKVFGYYIEVSKANLGNVPEEYERRQTLTGAERFILPELKAREAEILSAEERAMAKEAELFQSFRNQVLAARSEIQTFADALAQIDVLQSLAHVASERRFVRPEIRGEVGIEIVGGRHPVVEELAKGQFVPNDTHLAPGDHIIVLTGPNMGGKSTYMRQTAIIVMLAQMGSFVPAERAVIGVVDQIFARIGAADDLGRGQSTFMVEMIELAQILRQSTGRSLVLLDEIGRGTSTYDGLSIAEAVLEELASRSEQPLTMFATHYHELIGFSERFPSVRNYSMAVEETADGITFLHTVVTRPSDKSYGIQVAKLAGLPPHVVERAQTLLAARESQSQASAMAAATSEVRERSPEAVSPAVTPVVAQVSGQAAPDAPALALFEGPYRAFVERVAAENLLAMTPLDAMNRLNELIEKAKELLSWETSS
ncbi:DNA mismatch repair protein MutS [Alicyclobacillus acidoterrestris]|uniref:DNA mismatch repair protein MutS n=1 Tax=Alicyclobacillus suci TaxID=2816080 RepID=UPI00119395C5|nr:DNA mismatch repair protein MutS [Alicyclobacillus suci]GEO24900.1 DNA mismatch repair protein MutS [Alicyclobacillus acidoterrestris]